MKISKANLQPRAMCKTISERPSSKVGVIHKHRHRHRHTHRLTDFFCCWSCWCRVDLPECSSYATSVTNQKHELLKLKCPGKTLVQLLGPAGNNSPKTKSGWNSSWPARYLRWRGDRLTLVRSLPSYHQVFFSWLTCRLFHHNIA